MASVAVEKAVQFEPLWVVSFSLKKHVVSVVLPLKKLRWWRGV